MEQEVRSGSGNGEGGRRRVPPLRGPWAIVGPFLVARAL